MLKKPLIGLTLEQLRDVTEAVGLRPFAAKQIASWLYVKRATTIDMMTDLPKAARERLNAEYCVGLTAPKDAAVSVDGTVKYLFDGVGGRDIESVYIPDRDRAQRSMPSYLIHHLFAQE